MSNQPPDRSRILRFRRDTGGGRTRSDRSTNRLYLRRPAPNRSGLPAIPNKPVPYRPAETWGEDTPEAVRVVDMLLVRMVAMMSSRELWTFSSHAVQRISDSSVLSAHHRIDIPGGQGRAALEYVLELTGDTIEIDRWVRILVVLHKHWRLRYRVTPLFGETRATALFLELLEKESAE